MSWFNLLKYWGRRDTEFLQYCYDNKGKFIPIIDSITGEEIDEKLLIEQNELLPYQSIEIVENSHRSKNLKSKNKIKGRPRKSLNPKLRQEIIESQAGMCLRCSKENADQIHHLDGDPTNNKKHNLKLFCYDCHKIMDEVVRRVKRRNVKVRRL